MGLSICKMIDTPEMNKRYRVRRSRQDRALGSRPRYRTSKAGMQLAWDEENKRYSPRRLFAHWEYSHELELWERMGEIKGAHDPYLLQLLNLPAILLKDYITWWKAVSDDRSESYHIVGIRYGRAYGGVPAFVYLTVNQQL